MVVTAKDWINQVLPVSGHHSSHVAEIAWKAGPFRMVKLPTTYDAADRKSQLQYDWLAFDRGDAVAVLPRIKGGLDGNGKDLFILTYQFRAPLTLKGEAGWIFEIPAGMIAKEESPEAALFREFTEETGRGYALQISSIRQLGPFGLPPSPGGCSERIHLFTGDVVVTETARSTFTGELHEGESIMLVTLTMEELLQGISVGAITDMKTVLAIYHHIFGAQMSQMVSMFVSEK